MIGETDSVGVGSSSTIDDKESVFVFSGEFMVVSVVEYELEFVDEVSFSFLQELKNKSKNVEIKTEFFKMFFFMKSMLLCFFLFNTNIRPIMKILYH